YSTGYKWGNFIGDGMLLVAGGITALRGKLGGLGGKAGAGEEGAAVGKSAVSVSGGKATGQMYGPINKGPLSDQIAKTFRSGTYAEVTTSKPTTLYRVIGPDGNPAGSYWTRVPPNGATQSIIDSALNPQWGNAATNQVRAVIPAGTTFYEGVAAPQGGLVGGGNQIFIPKVNPSWIKGIVAFPK
ncbi:filamentous hemagglutinin, partial [Leptospira inadai serovar Lyme]